MTRNDGRMLGWERMARTGLGAAGLGIVLHATPSVAQTSGTNATSTAATLPPVTVEAPIQARPRTQPAQRASQSSRGRVATQRNAGPAPAGNSGAREAGVGRANASSESSYVADSSSAGTKTNTPLLETPQSISVVTRKELNDRAVQTLTEAVGYEPGVRIDASGYDPRFDAIAVAEHRLHFVKRLAGRQLARQVDQSAGRAEPVECRARPADHSDAVDPIRLGLEHAETGSDEAQAVEINAVIGDVEAADRDRVETRIVA